MNSVYFESDYGIISVGRIVSRTRDSSTVVFDVRRNKEVVAECVWRTREEYDRLLSRGKIRRRRNGTLHAAA